MPTLTVRYNVASGQILAEERGNQRLLYRSDALGSTVSLYDGKRNMTNSFTYWPYGETRTRAGSTGTKYKFVGTLGCRTQSDGGIYMRSRVEQPKHGRWITVDPLWPNEFPYSYADNEPTTITDSLGSSTNHVGGIIGAVIGAGFGNVCRLQPPDEKSGTTELCLVLCRTLLCPFKGILKKLCRGFCDNYCNSLGKGMTGTDVVARICLQAPTPELCYSCCEEGCDKAWPPGGQSRPWCINRCQLACQNKESGGGWNND